MNFLIKKVHIFLKFNMNLPLAYKVDVIGYYPGPGFSSLLGNSWSLLAKVNEIFVRVVGILY